MERDPFDEVITATLEELPAQFRELLDAANVEIIVEDEWVHEPDLYGLYDGIPLTERTSDSQDLRGPDRVYVFRRPLEEDFGAEPTRLAHEIRVTLLHELAHLFGIDDARLTELGWG